MHLAFVLFNYFPYGGLERDMLTIAKTCQQRGHRISIFTGEWQGELPVNQKVNVLSCSGFTNHGRIQSFIRQFQREMKTAQADVVIGFNRMPGLDVYFAADVCFAIKAFEERNAFYRLTPRCRHYLAYEKAVFAADSRTEILLISPDQIAAYQAYYQTPIERLHLLPPGIRRECIMPADYAMRRTQTRQKHNLTDQQKVLLFVGSDYRRKGLARVLQSMAALELSLRQKLLLWVVGQDKKQAEFERLAAELGVQSQVQFLGGRDDVPELMWAADALVHPAYSEAAGLVLLEAAVAGLPVIVAAVCGHAHYIAEYGVGIVLNEPFTSANLSKVISDVMTEERAVWVERSRHFSATADIFSLPERAAEIIEAVGAFTVSKC